MHTHYIPIHFTVNSTPKSSITYIMYTSASIVPVSPDVSVDTAVDASVSLSWSVPSDSVVTSFELVWISDDCPEDVDEGNATTTSTSYTIDALRGGTIYNITVSSTNAAGTSPRNRVTAKINELGKE